MAEALYLSPLLSPENCAPNYPIETPWQRHGSCHMDRFSSTFKASRSKRHGNGLVIVTWVTSLGCFKLSAFNAMAMAW